MGQPNKANHDLETIVKARDANSQRLVYSEEYGPALRKDKPKPFATDGPRIEPDSFYGRASFEDIVTYIAMKRYEIKNQHQRRTAKSLGVSARHFNDWAGYFTDSEGIESSLKQKYCLEELPEISSDSFYGSENIRKIMQHIVNQRVFNSESGVEAAKSLDISYSKMKRWMNGKGLFFYRVHQLSSII